MKSVFMFLEMLNENMEFPHKNEMTLKHITQRLVAIICVISNIEHF